MAYSDTPRPPKDGSWICCNDGNPVQTALNDNICPACFHEMCDSCEVLSGPSTPPVQDSRYHSTQHAGVYSSTPDLYAGEMTDTAGAIMTGWWRCCQYDCQREVSTAYYGSFCPDCGHQQCTDCEVFG